MEFSLSAALATLTLVGAGWLLKLEWDRARCAYLVFQRGHARLTGRWSGAIPSLEVRLTDGPSEVISEGRCGRVQERVTLPKLEPEVPEDP